MIPCIHPVESPHEPGIDNKSVSKAVDERSVQKRGRPSTA
jgi:hypothetical protein